MTESSFVANIEESVIAQIKVREEKFGKSPKTDEELSIIHGNCPWILLRSGIDAPVNDADRRRVFSRDEDRPEVTNDWAKKTVLGGELQDRSGTGKIRPSGIQTLPGDASNMHSSAYRITEYQGHRPVMGITEATIRSKDTWGMILEADVKIKCWSRDELDMLDRVYFKPGYAALLEWGHTAYYKEDGSKCITPQPMISDERFFDVVKGQYLDLDQEILDKRKLDSNREAVFGYITNFSFSLNKDGSYDCTLKILSKGSVIRGLKVKNASQKAATGESTEQDEILFEDISVWHRIYKAFEYFGKANLKSDPIESISVADPKLADFRQLSNRSGIPTSGTVFNGKTAILEANSEVTNKKLFDAGMCADLQHGFPVLELPIKIRRGFSFRRNPDKDNCEYYITLRSLLYLVNVFNSERKIQFNLWDQALYVDSTSEDVPTVSLNPYVAVKPKQAGTDYNLYKSGNILSSVVSAEEFSDTGGAKILNIWINFGQFVNEIHHQIENNVEEYSIRGALTDLLGRVQKAFGNINEFVIVTDHRLGGSFLSVIYAKCIAAGERTEPPAIQVTGLNNTVSNLTITSEISNDLANQMSIAAQAPKTYADGAESSDESMIHWGENCENRWVVPDESVSPNGGGGQEDYESKKREWIEKLKKQYKSVTDPIKETNKEVSAQDAVLSAAEERFQEVQLNGERFIHGQIAVDQTAAGREPNLQMGIIPIRAGLTMMGIGNLTIGNTFRIKSGVLLPKYQNWGHIITGIEHHISKARWETTLKTQYYPVYEKANVVVPTRTAQVSQTAVKTNVAAKSSTSYRTGHRADQAALDNDCDYVTAFKHHAGYDYGENKYRSWCAWYTYGWADAYVNGKDTLRKGSVLKKHSGEKYASKDAIPGVGTYGPAVGSVGNANSETYRNNIKNLGYTESPSTTMTAGELKQMKEGTMVGGKPIREGDVLVYYNSSGNMHTQFWDGKHWQSDTEQNSGGVYSGGTYTVYHLSAPKKSSDWSCGAH